MPLTDPGLKPTLSTPPQQFLSAVKYCHSHCVAHRDLKLDNTLLDRCGWLVVCQS